MKTGSFIPSIIIGLALVVPSAGNDAGFVSVGVVGKYQITIEGVRLKPKETTSASLTRQPIWIRSCSEVAHEGDKGTWVIEYAAWKAGDYDLRDLLSWSDGVNKEMVKRMIVTVIDPLPAGHKGNLEPVG